MIRKIKAVFKIMVTQPGNQSILLGQLIEYNMRNIFFEKSFTKCGGENIPRTFAKKSELNISQDQ